MLSEIVSILIALFMACWGAETSDAEGAAKKAEAMATINASLASPDGLHEPWWLPAGKVRDGLLSFAIDQLCKVEKKFGFFARVKAAFGLPSAPTPATGSEPTA